MKCLHPSAMRRLAFHDIGYSNDGPDEIAEGSEDDEVYMKCVEGTQPKFVAESGGDVSVRMKSG